MGWRGRAAAGHGLTSQATEQDAFEDAVDAASVRSLTKRSVSATRLQPSPPVEDAAKSDAESDKEQEAEEAKSVKSEEKPEPPSRGSTPLSHRISNISNTSNLDVVNLDDDAAPQAQGTPLSHRLRD